MKQINLHDGWQFVQLNGQGASGEWLPANVPGSVHQDLLQAGKIPDPFVGLNENDVQWIGEVDWQYRCTFDVPADALAEDQIDLCFDGLDTYATVRLNDQLILQSDNMFVPQRVAVKALLKSTGNQLVITFESALRRGKALEAQYGKCGIWNGDTSRAYVRKAQYHYGWDWGPCLLTAGLWRAVRLEAYSARIVDLHVPAEVSADLSQATLPVSVTLEHTPTQASLDLNLYNDQGQLVNQSSVSAGAAGVQHTISISIPDLWYPHGYGPQPRYRLHLTLRNGETILDEREMRLGLRRLRLIQEPIQGEPGTSFYFEINNIPIFCGGANWIPADSFTPRITAEQYRAWLQLAVGANMVMLRVWGGGIYEDDVFYELCDEMGLLVWQDFMFACGLYPAHPDYLTSVRAEAEANVKRLRQHVSLALWCGNNEDYQVAESQNAYDINFNGDHTQTRFPAREIYERLLPEVCSALDPTRPYWPSSPYGGVSVADQTIGDRHTWDVWHGKMADYHDYPKYEGRFVSEFGMQAAPEMVTIDTFQPPEDRDPYGPIFRHHNKATDGPERLKHYLDLNVPEPATLEAYVLATQFIQAEALAAGVEGWRRRWAGPSHYAVGGALIWQLNDCWPVTSWALADYYLRAKPAYYRVRRALASVALGVERTGAGAQVWAVNGTLFPVESELEVSLFALSGERLAQERRPVVLNPNQATELGTFFADSIRADAVVAARLLHHDLILARAAGWPEPPKSATYADPELQIDWDGDDQITVSVARPARAVYFWSPGATGWSDNLIDLLPGDERTLRVVGDLSALTAWHYGLAEPKAVKA